MRSGSVRARAALGATLVVAVALVAAGFLVVAVLRSGLGDNARLSAESTAREAAGQVTDVTADRAGDVAALDDDDPVQIVAAGDRVLGASEPLEGRGPFADFHHPGKAPATDDDADGDADDDGDDEGGD
ncbi:two-component sensor histidine kinase, partial [Streptomyces sp. SB3404]|nr:two-component sensor histidine kinase [Streptomyces boncukensis]